MSSVALGSLSKAAFTLAVGGATTYALGKFSLWCFGKLDEINPESRLLSIFLVTCATTPIVAAMYTGVLTLWTAGSFIGIRFKVDATIQNQINKTQALINQILQAKIS